MTILVYINTAKQVGDPEHVRDHRCCAEMVEENDPEGVAFEYEILE
jgi:hypothetical protein